MKHQILKELSELRLILQNEELRQKNLSNDIQIEISRNPQLEKKNQEPHQFESHYKEIKEILEVIPLIKKKANIIDEIVFKTQLLSFNASIEAERAGENGRGFSVVAQEIGNLAQTSGSAAADISELIKSSLKKSQQLDLNLRQILFQRKNKTEIAEKPNNEFFDQLREKIATIESTLQQMNTVEKEPSAPASKRTASPQQPPINNVYRKTEVSTFAPKDEFWPATPVNHRSGSDDPWEKIK